MFGFSKNGGNGSSVVPPVDLDQLVENPQVVAAMSAMAQSLSPESAAAVARALCRANFLVPILKDGMITSPADEAGQINIHAGSHINIIICRAEHGRALVPLFTDWREIRKWTDEPVSTLVMPAADAFSFASSEDYAGAVVNPGGQALELSRDQIAYLLTPE